ncbi:LysM peptidoglycan-binding domain-containing protein [Dysgonomonas sp. 216]|uniref:M23 family metallopeptidase n=1 Tax=Dysgonomonas sp. 216 TaxID=2302934 RepID=UPI0013D46AB0|nr:M23 family metallopeptidase [Dysgonomonas sp. 216]NDW19679.1 LysM peptidoglycan-binding domain-containing protein [Dysgonomonas sp. 216]
MESKKQPMLIKIKTFSLAAFMLLPLCAFASGNEENKDATENKSVPDTRIEVAFKQRHSRSTTSQNLYADGIKIKRDLSLIDKAREERILDADEIPADEIYGGLWSASRVNIYGNLTNIPDTFSVDLSNFTMPTMGHVTSNYGKRRRRFHHGIDLKVQTGDTIYATFDGKVRLCNFERRGYGYYVVLRHHNGLETVYGHLSKFLVSENDVVRSGDPIALGGNTGRSSGSHLHWEFRFLGQPFNPNHIVDFKNKVCHRDSYTISKRTFNDSGASSTVTSRSYAKTPANQNKYISGGVGYHRVTKGDTLSRIAKAHGTSIRSLCRLNNISETTTLRLGQSIRTK